MKNGSGSRRPKTTWIRRIRICNIVLSTGWFSRTIRFFFEMEFFNSIFSWGYWAYSQVFSDSSFVWFNTVVQNSYHEQAGFLVKRLKSFVNAIHKKTWVFLFRGFFVRIFKTREDHGFNQIPPVEGTVNSMEQDSSLTINWCPRIQSLVIKIHTKKIPETWNSSLFVTSILQKEKMRVGNQAQTQLWENSSLFPYTSTKNDVQELHLRF